MYNRVCPTRIVNSQKRTMRRTPCRSVKKLWFVLVALGCSVSLFISCGSSRPETNVENHPVSTLDSTGSLRRDLWKQGLSHNAFHKMKAEFAYVFFQKEEMGLTKTAVVGGVEYGADVLDLALLGFNVVGFEPNLVFANSTRDMMEVVGIQLNKPLKYVIVPKGLGEGRELATIEYQGRTFTSEIISLDEEIKEHVALLSLDTQQDQLKMLKGARHIMQNHGIDVIWIEFVACDSFNSGLLSLLSADYELFDFIWWGSPIRRPFNSSSTWEDMILPVENYALTEPTDRIDRYAVEMCRAREQKFTFLQTDIIAVRRSFFTVSHLEALQRIHTKCQDDIKLCPLRLKLPRER